MRVLRHLAGCGVLLSALAVSAPLAGQPADSATAAAQAGHSGPLTVLVTLGSRAEEEARLAQLRGAAPAEGTLLRSPSSLTPWRGRPGAALLVPELLASWNSRLPYGQNDGALWAGRGASVLLMAGAVFEAGPLRLILAPEVTWSQNRSFDDLVPPAWDSTQPGSFQPPWNSGRDGVDLPFRFGPDAYSRLLPGQSSLTLRAGAVALGASTEQQWWGPGTRWAVLFTNQAAGVPHLFLRTAHPLATPLGSLEGMWLAGTLQGSGWPLAGREPGRRALSSAALVLRPGHGGGPQLGLARSVYSGSERALDALGRGADVFTRWGSEGDSLSRVPYEQMVSVFGRWVFPADGAEIYAEWARYRVPHGLRGLLESPEHSQGYVLGGQWLRPAGRAQVRLHGELTFLERDPTWSSTQLGSWYASAAVPEGYTQQGQALGASVGPGGSGQWLDADWLRGEVRLGLFAGRIRWANDAYYDQLVETFRRYRGHQVSVLGGVHAGTALGPFALDARWTLAREFNVFFQNTGTNFNQRDPAHEVDAVNHSLELRLSARPPGRPR